AANLVSRAASRLSKRVAVNPQPIRRAALLVLALWVALPTLPRISTYRRLHSEHRRYREQFAQAVASLGSAPAIVFVRYAAGHGEERLVDNVPDLHTTKVWIVHDCGPENSRLLGLAPQRTPYLYEEWPDSAGYRIRISRMSDIAPDTTATSV